MSNSLRFGSLTRCIASEHQSYDEQLPEIRFTYFLHYKHTSAMRPAAGDSVHLRTALQSEPNVATWRATRGNSTLLPPALHSEPGVSLMASNSRDSVHLLSLLHSEPYFSHMASFRVIRFTYHLNCIASQTSAILRATPGDSVHLPSVMQCKPNVSYYASNSRRCGPPTSCIQ